MRTPLPYHNDNRDDPTGFRARARAHQSKFRQERMKVDFVDLYGTKISIDDGHTGMHNFHPMTHRAVKARYPNQRQTLYCDVLRSEHIPFNLFAPFTEHKELLCSVLNAFMHGTLKSVDTIAIEYAPQPKADYLNDATSFDAYIEYTHNQGGKGMIGIEVKYTEGDYTIGTKEAVAVNDPNSPYWNVTRQCNLYKPDCFPTLTTNQFRQVWRNQLLGESIKIKHPNDWKYFTLAMVYPHGNTHIGQVAEEYKGLLATQSNNSISFIPITYKSFLQSCSDVVVNDSMKNWLEWCSMRYIHD